MLVYPFLASAAVRQKYSGYLNTGKWQSNTRPIRHPTSFYHLNTKQVRYPDPHCMFFATINHTTITTAHVVHSPCTDFPVYTSH